MVKYLLDSNVLSEPARPMPNPGVMNRLTRHEGEIATAALVFHEMLHGVLRLPPSKRRKGLEDYLDEIAASVPILPYDMAAARWHAQERARLFQRTPPIVDSQIAAVAAVNHLIVVTANLADYRLFQGLPVENWMK
jgi:tRNA(fMet)-specific endonuclease VapC